jgi:hypothetical protein
MTAEQKIIVKPNLVIFKDTDHWDNIWQKILSEYGSTIAISWVLKRELGFTTRRHTHWINFFADGAKVGGYYQDQIHLDFYNESALSWFQLKYL